MTHRERLIAVLNGGKPDVIPLYDECPMDVTVLRGLLPEPGDDLARYVTQRAEFFDNSAVGCGLGHGIGVKTLSKDATHHTYRYETGAVWHESYDPTFCREALAFPVNSPGDALRFKMPDPATPGRFDAEGATRRVRALQDAGYFVQANVLGAWQGIYYYLASFDNILMWMAMAPEAARALFDCTRRFSIETARRHLACGVDCIFTPSDLGSGRGLLFSESMFREYVFPWLKELADLCHAHGAYLHLHSHGHIQDVMDGIVEAGVDMVNPIGPSDHNDLALFKARWGDKITLHGGVSTRIAGMSEEAMRRHVEEVVAVGRVGGRFFPRTESGIPPMPLAKTRLYVDLLREARMKGYA